MKGQDWDQEFPGKLEKWSKFFKELKHLNAVEFLRCLTPLSAITAPLLCVVSDASKKVFWRLCFHSMVDRARMAS